MRSAPLSAPLTSLVGALVALASVPAAQCPPEVLYDDTTEPHAGLGRSVAYDGTTLVAGAPGADGSGAVLIWRREAGAWNLEAEITGLSGGAGLPGDLVGLAVAVDGDRLVLTAPFASGDGQIGFFHREVAPGTGAVTWTENSAYSLFLNGIDTVGRALAIEDDLVVVGLPLAHFPSLGSGVFFYFEYLGFFWSPPRIAQSPAPEPFGLFGSDVALSGGSLAVGAPGEGLRGRIYVYHFDTAAGLFVQNNMMSAPSLPGVIGHVVEWGSTGPFRSILAGKPNSGAGSVLEFDELPQPFPQAPLWVTGDMFTATGGAAGDLFGHDISAEIPPLGPARIVIGAPGMGANGSVVVFDRGFSGDWQEKPRLEALDPGAGGNSTFGNFVDHAGSLVVACHSQLDGPAGQDQGAIVAFELNTNACTIGCTAPELMAPGIAADDNSGESVAVRGDVALVGTPLDDLAGTAAGAVRAYRRVGDCWILESTIVASDAAPGDRFGQSVAIDESGEFAVVGARLKNVTAVDTGGAYVLKRSGTAWIETQILEPIQPRFQGLFGHAVDISDSGWIVVGEPATFAGSGKVDVFGPGATAGSFVPHTEFFPADSTSANDFGGAVTVGMDKLVIGDGLDDTSGLNAGALHFYHHSHVTDLWSSVTSLFGSEVGERLGSSVDTDGFDIVAGAPFATVDGQAAAGRIHTFLFFGNFPLTLGTSGGATPTAGARLGHSIAYDAGMFAAGAHAPGTGRPGSVQTFLFVGLFPPFPTGEIVAPGVVANGEFGRSVAISGAQVLAGAPNDRGAGGAPSAGSAWAYDIGDAAPLDVDVDTISVSGGGTQNFALDLGPSFGGHIYWILGSASGSAPGLPLSGFNLPLNPDQYFNFTIAQTNGTILVHTLGTLDEEGRDVAALVFPPGAPILSPTYTHAALTFTLGPLTFTGATNPVEVDFLP